MCYKLLRKLLFLLNPESAHRFILVLLQVLSKLGFKCSTIHAPVHLMGLEFPNPVGLAAGLDKNAECIQGLSNLGFGFLEIGTVVPNPQTGNPPPRLFRLPQYQALINRMGFNSKGLDYFVAQLQYAGFKGILGISITANNDTPPAETIADYQKCLRAVYPYASYISLDISCPNVANKDFSVMKDILPNLLQAMKTEQTELKVRHQKYVPLAVKVSPDLTPTELPTLVELLVNTGMDGVIATNTTRLRPGVADPIAEERGGLSGKPLFALSLQTVKQLHALLPSHIPIIAVGGIMSADDAVQMLAAGASLVQIYTGLIYHGPSLIKEIVRGKLKCNPSV